MNRLRLLAVILGAVGLLLSAGPVRGQGHALSDKAQVSLITILPGDAVYSLFGHSALRVYDPVRGIDHTYNYGTFDFGNPASFVARFAYGKLDYFLSVHDYDRAVRHYWHDEGRPVIEQVLNLTAEQKDAVYRFLSTNALPENRYYRYDFFFDNCATRIRDVLEETLGNQVRFTSAPDPDRSFRQLLDPYLVERPFLHLGMDLGLGTPADRPASAREATFLPLYLMDYVGRATVVADGVSQPLVVRTDTVAWSAERATPDATAPWAALVSWILFIVVLAVTVVDVRTGRRHRPVPDALLYGALGVAGLLILFLWFVSLHTVTQYNYNLLWAAPTHLAAAIALARQSTAAWLTWYLALAAVAAGIVVIAWPVWPQGMHPATLPLVLLPVVRSGGLAWTRRHRARVAIAT